MKIHIMHILYSFGLGGLEGEIASLINKMDSATFTHSICVFSDELAALQKIKSPAVDVYSVKRRFRNDPSTISQLCTLLRKHQPDIVRTYNWTGVEGIIAAKLCGIKNIIHSEHGFALEEIFKRKRRRILARRFLFRYCAKIITVSQTFRRWLLDEVRVGGDRVVYIPNGCDLARFFPGKEVELRKSLGIKDNDIIIGTVGSLIELKNQKSLIEAFRNVIASYGNLKLMLVGEGPLRKELEMLVEKSGIKEETVFTGSVVEPAPFYRAMDIFVLPSLTENMPNTLLQAMATALPIIATDVGDIRYMLEGEKGGIVIKPKDIYALTSAIKYFLENPQASKERAAFGRARVENKFNISTTKVAYEALYKSVIS